MTPAGQGHASNPTRSAPRVSPTPACVGQHSQSGYEAGLHEVDIVDYFAMSMQRLTKFEIDERHRSRQQLVLGVGQGREYSVFHYGFVRQGQKSSVAGGGSTSISQAAVRLIGATDTLQCMKSYIRATTIQYSSLVRFRTKNARQPRFRERRQEWRVVGQHSDACATSRKNNHG